MSVDKSESTSSEDKNASTSAGPSNDIVTFAASGSNVQAILLNIRQPNRTRNYRKRKTPDCDTDSNTSKDSDDLSAAEENPANEASEEDMRDDNIELQRIWDFCASDSHNSNQSDSSNEHSQR